MSPSLRSTLPAFLLLLAACSAETSTPSSGDGPTSTGSPPSAAQPSGGGGDLGGGSETPGTPAPGSTSPQGTAEQTPTVPGSGAYRDYGAFVFTRNGAPVLSQSVLEQNGTRAWERTCPIAQGNVEWNACSAWGALELGALRGAGGESYSSYGAFSYHRAGALVVSQSVVEMAGAAGWQRECPVDTGGVAWNRCSAWSRVDLSSARGVGGERYHGYGAFVVHVNGAQVLTQSLLTTEGDVGWQRTCPVDDANGVQWGSCSAWSSVDLQRLRGVGDETYAGYGAFPLADANGDERITQSVLVFDGKTAYERTCPVNSASGVAWGACTGWGGLDLKGLVSR